MRKILIVLSIICSTIVFAQREPILTKTAMVSLKWTVDSKQELAKIKWNDVREVFKDNVKTDTISLAFELKDFKKKKPKYSFQVKGKSEDIESLISMAKKGIKVLNRIKS